MAVPETPVGLAITVGPVETAVTYQPPPANSVTVPKIPLGLATCVAGVEHGVASVVPPVVPGLYV